MVSIINFDLSKIQISKCKDNKDKDRVIKSLKKLNSLQKFKTIK